jgi:hypothetical protein
MASGGLIAASRHAPAAAITTQNVHRECSSGEFNPRIVPGPTFWFFIRLLDAPEPFIRVAAAVYLSFENEALGESRLEGFCILPGNPGTWAALTLARRGNKAAMMRALEAMRAKDFENPFDRRLNGNFALELAVLISNTAASNRVPQPSPPMHPEYLEFERQRAGELYAYYLSWWLQYRDRIHLTDPWLNVLRKQKID